MRKTLIINIFIPVLFVSMTVLGITAGTAAAKTYNFTYSTFFPPTHIQATTPMNWAKDIETRSNGQIKIKFFPGGSLTPAPQIYDGVVKGISDFGMSCFCYSPGRFPVMAAVDNPLGYSDAFSATRTINALNEKLRPKELQDTHVCYLFAHGPGLLHTAKKPVRRLEEVAGMKIRSTGTSQWIARAFGASPVSMSQGETYDALAKGIVEGTLVPIEALEGFKQAEVLKYTTLNYSAAYSIGFFVTMNLNKWNSLPKDLQDIITEVSEKYKDITAKAWGDSDESGRQFALGLGHEFIELSEEESAKFGKAVEPVLEQYIEQANEKGVDGKAVMQEVQALIKKFNM